MTRASDEVVQTCAKTLIDEGASLALVDTDGAKAEQVTATLKAPRDPIMWLAKEEGAEIRW